MKGRRRILLGVLAAGVALTALYLARGRLLPAVARWLDVGEPPNRAEYVMVLPGDENARPFVAAAIMKAGLAGQALVPETATSPSVEDGILPPTHEIICRVLRYRGVEEEDIVILDGQSRSTFGDIRALARFLEASPQARVTLVTSGYHTRRTRWTVDRLLGERARQVTFVSAPTDGFGTDRWWEVDEGFIAIVGEYLKLGYYALRYTGIGYWMGGCAGLVVIGLAYRQLRSAAA